MLFVFASFLFCFVFCFCRLYVRVCNTANGECKRQMAENEGQKKTVDLKTTMRALLKKYRTLQVLFSEDHKQKIDDSLFII